MKQRLEELLFEWQLLKLLELYDPDRVFRFLANSCVLFNIEIETIQQIIFDILDNRRTALVVLKEILTILKRYEFTPTQIRELLNLHDKRKVYNLLRFDKAISPCVMSDEQRRQALALYYHLHQLGAALL